MGNGVGTLTKKASSGKSDSSGHSKMKIFKSYLKKNELWKCFKIAQVKDTDQDSVNRVVFYPIDNPDYPGAHLERIYGKDAIRYINLPHTWQLGNEVILAAKETKNNANPFDDPDIAHACGTKNGSTGIEEKTLLYESGLLHKRLSLMKKLSESCIDSRFPERGVDSFFQTVEDLRATGLQDSEELVFHLILMAQLHSDYNWIINAIDNSHIEPTVNAIKEVMLNHA